MLWKNFNFRTISGLQNFISGFRAYYQKTQNKIRILSFLVKIVSLLGDC